MVSQINPRKAILIYFIPLAIIGSSISIGLSQLFEKCPELSIGITYDLTIVSPLIYFLIIRKKTIPKITVIPFFIIGIIIANWLLPEGQQTHLNYIETYLFPVVELTFLTTIFWTISKIKKNFKQTAHSYNDFYSLLKESIVKAFGHPKTAKIFTSEIAMIYFSLFCWKKKKINENQFTSYNENGVIALFGAILFIILTETFVVHLLLVKSYPVISWILLAGSCYGALQLFGHLKAIKRRFIEISSELLYLRNGLFSDAIIPISEIEKIEFTSNDVNFSDKKIEQLALLKGLEGYNTVIHFKSKQMLEKAYGIQREVEILLLQVDQKELFHQKIIAINSDEKLSI
ncbi:MAG: hypothetical protein HYR91_07530 [Flavobacteriia bacterium]|nr:hypothetical protein [Flavobacteriia bacterium]